MSNAPTVVLPLSQVTVRGGSTHGLGLEGCSAKRTCSAAMYGSMGSYKTGYGDLETGYGQTALYPGISAEDNTLRWAFIRKVYGILSTQLLLTAIVGAVVVVYTPIRDFFISNPFVLLAVGLFSMISKFSSYSWPQSRYFCSYLSS